MLRGVNVGGDSKVPYPRGGTQYPSDFSDHRAVSFVGRPFPLHEVDAHFGRIQAWGFNCIRLIVTWEAIEHAGPGIYDAEYLDYLEAICAKAQDYGLRVIVDMHQDCWARMSGGDGAPGWTFEAAGLDFCAFHEADAAHVMQHQFDYRSNEAHQGTFPSMSWVRNYRLAANGIMWTLFWGGRTLTPQTTIQGHNIQDYLQAHFFGSVAQVAQRLAKMPHVVGFDILNEPSFGWIGQALSTLTEAPFLRGPAPTPLQLLASAQGLAVEVQSKLATSHEDTRFTTVLLNAAQKSIWLPGVACPFERAGIYRIENGQAHAVQEGAFAALDKRVHALHPFLTKAFDLLQGIRSDWLLFAQTGPLEALRGEGLPEGLPSGTVHACHWYDLPMLAAKAFAAGLEQREQAETIRQRYIQQMAQMKNSGTRTNMPTLIGEFGIPFDAQAGAAYVSWKEGDDAAFVTHGRALSLMYDALDALLLSATQWNYSAGNRNAALVGDQWNQEDFSIWSQDQVDPTRRCDGARALEGFARPYVAATQGELMNQQFASDTGRFEATWNAMPNIDSPTEIRLPAAAFPTGCSVMTEGPVARWSHDEDVLRVWAEGPGPCRIICSRVEGVPA